MQKVVFRGRALLATTAICALCAAIIPQALAAPAEPVANAAAENVETVVVTGEKMNLSLQKTTTSVSVITAEKIERENIHDLFAVINSTANVSSLSGARGFTIRGVSNRGVSGGGNDGLATIYVDDVAMPDRAVFSSARDMWDVSQVEVLRGPQSTVQGRNSLAGAIVVTTAQPTMDWHVKARAQISNYGGREFAVAGGGPLIKDQLAFRIAVDDAHSDGFIHNTVRDDDADPSYNLNLRAKVLWLPKAVPGLEVDAAYSHNTHKSGYVFSYVSTDVANYYDHREDNSDYPNTTDEKMDAASLKVKYQISPSLHLTSIASWNRVDDTSTHDSDFTSEDSAYSILWHTYDTWSEEMRLQYSGHGLDALFGLYFFDRDYGDSSVSHTNVTTPQSTLTALLESYYSLDEETASAAAATYADALPVIPVSYTSDAPRHNRTYAAFFDGRYALTDQLSLIAGFRYDYERNALASTQTAVFIGDYPDPDDYGDYASYISGMNSAVVSLVDSAGSSAPKETKSSGTFLPKVGLSYDLTDTITTSFVAQRGYRSGGASVNVAQSTVVPYNPEYTWNYEFSVKSSWLDNTLTANANAYYVDWTDQQVVVQMGSSTYDYQTENAGKSHMYGFELEVTQMLSDAFDWYGSLGYSRTKFDDFNVDDGTTTTSLAGSQFAYAPHWTGALGINYRFLSGFALNVNGNYRSGAYTATGTTQKDYRNGGRLLVNGKLSYTLKRWSLYVYANNIFDKDYVEAPYKSENLALLGDPQVFGFGAEVHL